MTFFGLTMTEVAGIMTAAVILAGAIKTVSEIVTAIREDRRKRRRSKR